MSMIDIVFTGFARFTEISLNSTPNHQLLLLYMLITRFFDIRQASHSQKACSHVHTFQAQSNSIPFNQLKGLQAMPAAKPPSLPKLSHYIAHSVLAKSLPPYGRTKMATLILTLQDDKPT